jgi:hypothetical protein
MLSIGIEKVSVIFTNEGTVYATSLPVPAYLKRYIEDNTFELIVYINSSLRFFADGPQGKTLYIIDDIPSEGMTLGISSPDFRVLFMGSQSKMNMNPSGKPFQLEWYGQKFILEDITQRVQDSYDSAIQERFSFLGEPCRRRFLCF